MHGKIFLLIMLTIATPSLQAVRLRFILINETEANLFACLRSHDCDPMNEAEMRPGESENIYTDNFKTGITRFVFKFETSNESTAYEVVYNSHTKQLQLQRNGIVFEETSHSGNNALNPPVLRIDKKLDAHFDAEALYDNQKITGMNQPNKRGYKPSLYLGDSGQIHTAEDKNRFCSKSSRYRNDLKRLSSYVGICEHAQPHDNLNPFCRKKINWSQKRHSCKKC